MVDNKSLNSILKEQGVLSDEQVKKVRIKHTETGKKKEEIIREENFASEEQIAQAKAELYNVPFVDLEKVGFSPMSIATVPRSVAERYHLMPFDVDEKNNQLKVAMANPLDLETIEFLERKSEMKIQPYLGLKKQIDEMIVTHYEQELSFQVEEALGETKEKMPKDIPDLEHLDEIIREAPVAKIVGTILQFAMKARASDVHLEPKEEETRVRYRIDGILHEKLILPRKVHDAVVSRIKILADLKIDERRVPQDGRFSFTADDEGIDLRVSTAPTVHGEKVVMRLLKKQQDIPDLPQLGLRGKALRNFREMISRPQGLVIVCGPTGSGKTTTLYSALSRINTVKVNTMTVEDPVEYEIEGVNQVQVNPQAGLTFSSALRSFLRQDPDIMMVGEIRDEETTELSIHAALTGHLVFSTLHTNSAAGTPPRLIDMGAEPFLMVSSLTCVVGQRVMRRLCESCKKKVKASPEQKKNIKEVLGKLYEAGLKSQKKKSQTEELTLWESDGCDECNGTGYKGRVGIFEVFTVSDKIAKLIVERASASNIEKQAREQGMMTMKQDGYLKALEGITTIEEVLRVAEF